MREELFTMWGGMHGVQAHHANCRARRNEIAEAFETSSSTNEVLSKLLHIEGVGLTIATGLLWAAHPERCVPFDQKTMGYCLRRGVLRSDRITGDYERACKKLVHIEVGDGKKHATIKDLVHFAENTPADFWCSPR